MQYLERRVKVRDFRLYVLELADSKYYVGMTCLPVSKRLDRHMQGKGSLWTKEHRPVRIIDTRELGSMSDVEAEALENDLLLEYVDKVGLPNVRGGTVCCMDELRARRLVEGLRSKAWSRKQLKKAPKLSEHRRIKLAALLATAG